MNDMTRQEDKMGKRVQEMAWLILLAGAAASGFLFGVSFSALWGWW